MGAIIKRVVMFSLGCFAALTAAMRKLLMNPMTV